MQASLLLFPRREMDQRGKLDALPEAGNPSCRQTCCSSRGGKWIREASLMLFRRRETLQVGKLDPFPVPSTLPPSTPGRGLALAAKGGISWGSACLGVFRTV